MGSQIAALLASFGYNCDLLDIVPPSSSQQSRNIIAESAIQKLKKASPPPALTKSAYNRIFPGNVEDDLERLRSAQWIIEAVIENLEIKQQVWSRLAPYIADNAIVSTNTSGLPVKAIADILPAVLRKRFLGAHFFNPPRYLRLVELIPLPETSGEVVDQLAKFLTDELGKGVVIARDTPNFIANRIGCFGLMATLEAMDHFGFAPDEVDVITGPPMGRPRSATFRTLDLVGLDVFADVARNMQRSTDDPQERKAFELPEYIKQMLEKGWLGEKAGQGFYRRERDNSGRKIFTLDPKTMTYRPRRRFTSPLLETVSRIEDPAERIRQLIAGDDAVSHFAWWVISKVLHYAAQKAPEISGDIASIDRAMVWGFGWELGPFQIWDALGMSYVVNRMKQDGLELPGWIRPLLETKESFYIQHNGQTMQVDTNGKRIPAGEDERKIWSTLRRRSDRLILRNPGASLLDMGDGVALLDFHSPRQAIGPDFINLAMKAADVVEKNYDGLVISATAAANFCVGANLFLILTAAQEEDWDELDLIVRSFQNSLIRLKYLNRPVVVAPFGQTLGGGVEVVFAADKVVAAAETYLGLVEVGAGVIPAGGGCKEMLIRSTLDLHDMQPAVNHVFELIGTARVAASALEAQELGYLRPSDKVVPNPDHLLRMAKQQVLALNMSGYRPPRPVAIPVIGREGRALLELGAYQMYWGGYATEHDLLIAKKLAYVLSGGDVAAGTQVDEQYLLDLEREAFLSLLGEPKTQQRMQHLLKTGKPLRN